MGTEAFRTFIASRFRCTFVPAGAVVCTFGFADGDAPVQARIDPHGLTLLATGGGQPPSDVTLMFHSVRDAVAILGGSADWIEAFLTDRIRSDGHLILALQIAQSFR